jgi:hypothetical protein
MRRSILLLTGIGLLLSISYVIATLGYPRGTPAQPGPGLYPLLVGLFLIVGCLGISVEEWKKRSEIEEKFWPQGSSRWRLLAILLTSLIYVILLPYLGHPITGTLLMLVVFRVMQMKGWLVCVALAAAMGFGSYYLFKNLLGVQLPIGIWFY